MLTRKSPRYLCGAAVRRGVWSESLEEDCRARPVISFPHLVILLASRFSDSQVHTEITGKLNERKTFKLMDKRESEVESSRPASHVLVPAKLLWLA